MTKFVKDFIIKEKRILPSGCCLMTLSPKDGKPLPEIVPGQFVEVKVNSPSAFLRRPISVCDITGDNGLVLFIKPVGEGSRFLTQLEAGSMLNLVYPLGNGFCTNKVEGKDVLLAGGGVGAAPLVFLSRVLASKGAKVTVALGGRTTKDLEGLPELYESAENVVVSTDNGSRGHHGLITANPVFDKEFDFIYCCGPTPMMKGIASIARERNIPCEVSLENMMACGLGACLCCVQSTTDSGNVCVCSEGPVFNINRLEKWI